MYTFCEFWLASTTATLGWFIIVSIYNRYFHPLAHIPGPFWGSVGPWYKLFVIKSIPTLGFRLHEIYGPVVRIAPNSVIFNDPTLLPEVYHRKAEKTSLYSSWMFGDGIQSMFLTPKHNEHAAKKRVIRPTCSLKALRGFEDRFDERVDELCCAFDQRFAATGKPVDFAEWLRWFLWDTFTHLAYGQAAGSVRQGQDVGGTIQALKNIYSMAASVAILPSLLLPIVRNQFVRRFLLPCTTYGKGMSQLFLNFQSNYSQSRQKNADGFLDRIDAQLSPEEVRAEHVTFTAAALDGAAAFISPFIDNMTQHPRVLAKILAEIDSTEHCGALTKPVAKLDEIIALPYFQACIMESLRRDGPAQTILPRVTPEQGIRCSNGLLIPGGVEMAACPYIIHRDAKVFGAEPEAFRPERWLQSTVDVSRMMKYGMWWGYGERRCAGEHYAQLQVQKLCFELVRRFTILSASPEKRFEHEKWAVGMYWHQWLHLRKRCGFDGDGAEIDTASFEMYKEEK